MKTFQKIEEFVKELGMNYQIEQEDDVITVRIEDTSSKEERKAEFESLVQQIDDDLFIDTMKKVNTLNLSERYENFPETVYKDFLKNATEVLNDKIFKLNRLTEDFGKFLSK